jgi:hypothetical protein
MQKWALFFYIPDTSLGAEMEFSKLSKVTAWKWFYILVKTRMTSWAAIYVDVATKPKTIDALKSHFANLAKQLFHAFNLS